MKAFLLHPSSDFEAKAPLPWNEGDLRQDLELDTLFGAMSGGDEFILEAAKRVVLASLREADVIRYRQDILGDALRNPEVIRGLYALAVEALEAERRSFFGILGRYPSTILGRSLDVLQIFVRMLRRLRSIAEQQATTFVSEGFRRLFAMLERELSDEYFATIQGHLAELKFRRGVLMSARLDRRNKGAEYVLRTSRRGKPRLLQRLFERRQPVYTFTIADRDEAGARALSDLKDRGLNIAANALAQSADHIQSFFSMLRTELAFYIGCLNLQARLAELAEPTAIPMPAAPVERAYAVRGLYDPCLALTLGRRVVGNAVDAGGAELVFITGANTGGKSTFLRAVGVAQLMMQSGMFVPAESLRGSICENLMTHFRRKEDASMKSGKLDEELARMSEIVDHATPRSMVLFNESFSATNEREGSEIARQVVAALVERSIRVFYVTHLYELAHGFHERHEAPALFLLAERKADGTRTFKMIEGTPQATSYGEDLYREVIANDEAACLDAARGHG